MHNNTVLIIIVNQLKNGLAEAVDLVGWNYKPRKYKEVLSEYPEWIVYGSEILVQ